MVVPLFLKPLVFRANSWTVLPSCGQKWVQRFLQKQEFQLTRQRTSQCHQRARKDQKVYDAFQREFQEARRNRRRAEDRKTRGNHCNREDRGHAHAGCWLPEDLFRICRLRRKGIPFFGSKMYEIFTKFEVFCRFFWVFVFFVGFWWFYGGLWVLWGFLRFYGLYVF